MARARRPRERRVDRPHAGVPEEAVVDQEQLRALRRGQLEQLRMRRDPCGDRRDLLGPGHLQAIEAVVLEAIRFEQTVELGQQLAARDRHALALLARGHGRKDSGRAAV
jgi:hypothetical protein